MVAHDLTVLVQHLQNIAAFIPVCNSICSCSTHWKPWAPMITVVRFSRTRLCYQSLAPGKNVFRSKCMVNPAENFEPVGKNLVILPSIPNNYTSNHDSRLRPSSMKTLINSMPDMDANKLSSILPEERVPANIRTPYKETWNTKKTLIQVGTNFEFHFFSHFSVQRDCL